MANAPNDVSLMLRLVTKIQKDIGQLSPQNQWLLLDALGESIPRDDPKPASADAHSHPFSPTPKSKPAASAKRKKKPVPNSGRKTIKGSVPDLSIKAVLDASEPIGAGDVLVAVKKTKPNVKPVGVYAALHAAAKKGQIKQDMDGTKALYSKPTGGKKK